ncbi:potassium transporter Kup [Spirosoma sp. HMF4905]|uniref:Probable potassium transport system protein Kup n=1 Tax=Spirosoma arboris TaxID=2682092 RepID=A0A7K1SPD0_9BACT|nr:KUP/HAK/KT family potassium transporter [Spirosoma arboris]MVM35672.1 potassium transporter Kup [Spirosoma arboris]
MADSSINKVSTGGLLIAIGIVFGDIGTSPLYVLAAVVRGHQLTQTLVLGTLSCIIWTLTIQTTIKYVLITLQADNKGEGGIFSLYALVHRFSGRWLLIPAIVGGAFLLADGLITPPISVSSAIEGLLIFDPKLKTEPIVIGILIGLFVVQQFGTQLLGKLFGPVMLLWFTFIGAIGLLALLAHPSVLLAVNPLYAFRFLTQYPGGFWLLGGVFLCTTGAEALYSDMGHCGRGNIRVSWFYVKLTLLLSYVGQTAYLMNHLGQRVGETSPFYSIVPPPLTIFSIILATLATIIASQALISGAFTLVGEAMRLNFWPRQRVVYPSDERGQLYVPFVNWGLMVGCILIVLHFRESKNMEAAYGLAVTLTMLMSTLLINAYLRVKQTNSLLTTLITALFLVVEITFLIANLVKVEEGGWISITLGLLLMGMMVFWYQGETITHDLIQYDSLPGNLPVLKTLSNDLSVPKFATHLVYLTSADDYHQVEAETLFSILNRAPKRADIYWFIHLCVLDEPYGMRYKVDTLAAEDVYFVTFYLGFRVEPRLNFLFRQVVLDMVADQEVTIETRYRSLNVHRIAGDFRFVLFKRFLSYDNELSLYQQVIMRGYLLLKRIALSTKESYGLDTSNVVTEAVPLVLSPIKRLDLERLPSALSQPFSPPV